MPQTGRLLVVENGVYGERIAQMCAQYRIAHERISGDWMQAPDLAAIEARLGSASQSVRFTHLAVVHHETTTGRLNDLGALGTLCRAHGTSLLIDGVSSFGAEAIDFTDGSLAAVAATANKCLHGVPGASFVIVRRGALEQAASRAFYLDLGRLARLQDQRGTPFTPAVHAYYALVEALREYAEAGGRLRSPSTLFGAGGASSRRARRVRNRRGGARRTIVGGAACVPLAGRSFLYGAA